MAVTRDDETAGAIEHFEDAALYDHDYRRRRDDVRFYQTLAAEHGGRVLDLACGTGRIMVPLLRDGHTVVGLDHAPAMLARAAAKIAQLPAADRARALLMRADLRRFAFHFDGNPESGSQTLPRGAPTAKPSSLRVGLSNPRRAHSTVRSNPASSPSTVHSNPGNSPSTVGTARPFGFAVAAFHSVQHLVSNGDLLAFLRCARRALEPGGWLAFDVFAPERRFIERDEERRWDRTAFHDPTTGRRLVYTINHHFDRRRRTLLMRMYYLPVDGRGRATGPERVLRLCHRQLATRDVRTLLARAGLRLIASWSDFAGGPLRRDDDSEQHIYLAKPR